MPSPSSIQHLFGWRRAVLWPLGLFIRLWGWTLRFEISAEDRRAAEMNERPVAIILWHNRLFLASEVYRRYRKGRPTYALISASKDGGWLAAFFSLVGMRAVRGSSSRFGREAAGALVETIRAGHDVGITPDGPRGPCYDFKSGALVVVRRTSAPMILIGGEFSSAWRLRSWDRFYIPKPFSRVTMRFKYIPSPMISEGDDAAEGVAAQLREINPD